MSRSRCAWRVSPGVCKPIWASLRCRGPRRHVAGAPPARLSLLSSLFIYFSFISPCSCSHVVASGWSPTARKTTPDYPRLHYRPATDPIRPTHSPPPPPSPTGSRSAFGFPANAASSAEPSRAAAASATRTCITRFFLRRTGRALTQSRCVRAGAVDLIGTRGSLGHGRGAQPPAPECVSNEKKKFRCLPIPAC